MEDPADLRRSYERATLTEADLAPSWSEQFARWFDDAVAAGLAEPNAMVLATADAEGRTSARTVLLKGVDPAGFVLYTNLTSRKGRDVASNPHASLVFPWIDLQRQVVVSGRVEPVDPAEADAYFARRPHGSQVGAHVSPQGQVIPSRDVLDRRAADLEREFPPGAAVPRPGHWGGLRVVPDVVEFWQGRPDRLHDRMRFRREGPGDLWVVERVAP